MVLHWGRHDSSGQAAARDRDRLGDPGAAVRTFRYLMDPVCLGACLLYAATRWLVLSHMGGAFLHGQFNDLLLIPAALPPVLWLQRMLGLRDHDRPPLGSEIWTHLAVWSVLFEVIGPKVLPVTGDVLDVLAYAAGGLASGLWWNRLAVQPRACG
jgi:hypothetical protein